MYPPNRVAPHGMDTVDFSPLLRRSGRILSRPTERLRRAAGRLFRQASSRRMSLREPSVRVRENAAEQIEERQSEWTCSAPVVILDVIWNLAFVLASMAALGFSIEETPIVPLRVWIIGYDFECLLHVVYVIVKYKRRREDSYPSEHPGPDLGSNSGSLNGGDEEGSDGTGNGPSFASDVAFGTAILSYVWWGIGFYWVTTDSEILSQTSPQLYWVCVAFLALDMIFVVVCVAVACLIGLAICSCLPCIIAVLYAFADRDGATNEEIDQIPKFTFLSLRNSEKSNDETRESHGGIMVEFGGFDSPTKHMLSSDDVECCICLCPYENGAELRELCCGHHFHSDCIQKWLRIKATCPLCKFRLLKPDGRLEDGSHHV